MSERKLPETVVPVLEDVRRRWFSPDTPLDFWTVSADEHRMTNGFMELAGQLYLQGALVPGLKPGYGLIFILFNWETQQQFNGWTPIFEISDDHFGVLCNAYNFVGLEKESKALARARAAAEDIDDHDAVAAAYREMQHEYSVDLDRIAYLAQWFCDHADDLLYD